MRESVRRVTSWLEHPNIVVVRPSESHWQVLQQLLQAGQAVGNLAMDAHLAAIAIEHGCTLCSSDSDFSRFKGLRWINPLRE
jgi:hypothetical protein